jgi:hypothetical protein
MNGPESWFAILQTGKLLSYGPISPFKEEPEEFYEIMQYIDQEDKTGKRIFEGDLLKIENKFIQVVRWNKAHSCFGVGYRKGSTTSFLPSDSEIVGNICANPELLEEGR